MGMVISKRELSILDKSGLMRPLIYCNPGKEIEDMAISINVALANILLTISPNRRTMRMERCVQKVLSGVPKDAIIKDFDVMFNPEYEADILRIIIAQYRVKPFDVIWPGRYEKGKLVYAEEGFWDYRFYKIDNYDVTCVI